MKARSIFRRAVRVVLSSRAWFQTGASYDSTLGVNAGCLTSFAIGPHVGEARLSLDRKFLNRPCVCWTAVAVLIGFVISSLGISYRCAARNRQAYLSILARVQIEGGRWEQVVGALGQPDGTIKLNRFITK